MLNLVEIKEIIYSLLDSLKYDYIEYQNYTQLIKRTKGNITNSYREEEVKIFTRNIMKIFKLKNILSSNALKLLSNLVGFSALVEFKDYNSIAVFGNISLITRLR